MPQVADLQPWRACTGRCRIFGLTTTTAACARSQPSSHDTVLRAEGCGARCGNLSASGGFLQGLQLVVPELEDRAAARADHVVVVLVSEHVFEPPAAVAGVQALDCPPSRIDLAA